MFVLPNGKKIDEEGVMEAMEEVAESTRYFLSVETGDVCIIEAKKEGKKIKQLLERGKYFEIPKMGDAVRMSWLASFVKEILDGGDSEEKELDKKITKTLAENKKGAFDSAVSVLEKSRTGVIHGWVQWQGDHVWEEMRGWFKKLPVDIEEKFEGCGDCELCKLMEKGGHSVGDFMEVSAKEKKKNKKEVVFSSLAIVGNQKIMPRNIKNIYQFKISLSYSTPLIWRRIQVPEDYTFWELHCAIQDVMGWSGGHLHGFSFTNKKNNWQIITITTPMPDDGEYIDRITDERTAKIADYFGKISKQCKYEYDFGDGWVHSVLLEKVAPEVSGEKYPKCLTGKRACPPDDCGGMGGYENLLDILKKPKHKEHKEMLEWLCIDSPDEFDAEVFNASEVVFDDPIELLKEFENSMK